MLDDDRSKQRAWEGNEMKVYVCSSWRNEHYPAVLAELREAGHQVWDWRNPPTGGNGFRWQDAGAEDYQHGDKISPQSWRSLLMSPIAQAGFASDLSGMNWCDVGVLLHPCGRSAHLEAGWIAGRGKKVHVLAPEPVEPDLTVLALNGKIFGAVQGLIGELGIV
jgi:hypothetical protein